MKYLILLLMSSSIFCMEPEHTSKAREKAHRYAQFLQAMKVMEAAERVIVIKPRNMEIPPLIMEDEEEQNEFIVLSKEDFDTTTKANTLE